MDKNKIPIATSSEKLLFLILETLEKIAESINEDGKTQKKKITSADGKPKKVCKHCGQVHNKPVDYAVCANKNKKKEV